MFDDVWSEKHNVVKKFDIPHSWKITRSFDWGSSAPFSVGWWAISDGSDYVDGDGKWRSSVRGDRFRIAEWYGWTGEPNEGVRMLAADIAKGIVERQLSWNLDERVKPGPADTSIWTEENGPSIATDMEKPIRLASNKLHKGVKWTRADKRPGSRKAGWQTMRTYFKNAHPPKEGGPREKPGLFVFEGCAQFRRTVPVLPRSDKDLDDVNTDTEDHIADEARYMIRDQGTSVKSGRTSGMY
jgi:hypothetical protein